MRSSCGVTAAPMARLAAKTTPMAASAARPVFFCRRQTRSVPRNKVAAPPISGFTFRRNAMPRPGRAKWETTSLARTIRFISAKQPTRPAARAKNIASSRSNAWPSCILSSSPQTLFVLLLVFYSGAR